MKDVNDEVEARKRGFLQGTKSFKILHYDIILASEEESKAAFERKSAERAKVLDGKL